MHYVVPYSTIESWAGFCPANCNYAAAGSPVSVPPSPASAGRICAGAFWFVPVVRPVGAGVGVGVVWGWSVVVMAVAGRHRHHHTHHRHHRHTPPTHHTPFFQTPNARPHPPVSPLAQTKTLPRKSCLRWLGMVAPKLGYQLLHSPILKLIF